MSSAPSVPPQKQDDAQQKQKVSKANNSNKKEPEPEKPWTDALQQDLDRILSVGEECISPAELKSLLLAKRETGFNLYDGFEPSGRMHIAQGVFKAMNVNKCTSSGGTFVFWVADWFALMNDKMGGDLEKIRIVGEYLQQVWKAAGMNLENVVFKWASEEITEKADKYWPLMLDVARRFNITRIKKCCQIMGRLEGALTTAQILYPLMQCTDVFFLKADICQLGVDQRKVNMLAREYCDFAKIKRKPVILSHHMLYGLKAGQAKMSKSDADSAVFMEDAAEDVERKIMQAYCPIKEEETAESSKETVEDAGKETMNLSQDNLKNPCLDYIDNIIFAPPGATFTAGGTTYTEYAAVREAFLGGNLSEEHLKKGLTEALNLLLAPVRKHFTEDEYAKDLLAKVQRFKKEGSPLQKLVRRLNLVELGKVEANSHLVFVPPPSAAPSLQQAIDTLAQLKASGDKPKVLYLQDWTARVCNSCDADAKAIAAFYEIFLTSLKALDPELMATVKVILQSEAILSDPSNYWVSVINVGRHFMLNEVMGEDMKDADGVGGVIGRLMQVADVVGVDPASVALPAGSVVQTNMISKFYAEKLEGMTVPSIEQLNAPVILLQKREEAHKTDNDEYFLLDDPKVNGKSKVTKAFCEPGNVAYCPPIALASTFALADGEWVVKRSPENGGDATYKSRQEIEKDFESGGLHPGDLKSAAAAVMVKLLEKLSAGIKENGEATKAAKTLKAFAKKMAKNKSKK